MKYASFWSRYLASLLDGIIVYILSYIVCFVFGYSFRVLNAGNSSQSVAQIQVLFVIGAIIGLIIGWLYYALSESSHKQATLGKQALGIIVTDINGYRISFGKATARYFCEILSFLPLFIGYIMAAFTKKKQALHDIIVGTLVLKK